MFVFSCQKNCSKIKSVVILGGGPHDFAGKQIISGYNFTLNSYNPNEPQPN